MPGPALAGANWLCEATGLEQLGHGCFAPTAKCPRDPCCNDETFHLASLRTVTICWLSESGCAVRTIHPSALGWACNPQGIFGLTDCWTDPPPRNSATHAPATKDRGGKTKACFRIELPSDLASPAPRRHYLSLLTGHREALCCMRETTCVSTRTWPAEGRPIQARTVLRAAGEALEDVSRELCSVVEWEQLAFEDWEGLSTPLHCKRSTATSGWCSHAERDGRKRLASMSMQGCSPAPHAKMSRGAMRPSFILGLASMRIGQFSNCGACRQLQDAGMLLHGCATYRSDRQPEIVYKKATYACHFGALCASKMSRIAA